MTLSRNRSLIVAEAIANDNPLFSSRGKDEADRWNNERGGVEFEKLSEDQRPQCRSVIPWLQYAAKRIYTKKVAPDYAMQAYARKLAATSQASQFSGKVA